VQQALERLGTARPLLGIVFVPYEYSMNEVFAGLTSLLGSMPLWGMSTSRPITIEGEQPHSVVLAILSGTDWKTQIIWQPQFSRDSAGAGRELAQALHEAGSDLQGLLMAADGIQGDVSQILPSFTNLMIPISGGLAAGEVHLGKTYQFGGNQWASGALSALTVGGRLRLGVGIGSGWQDSGIHFIVTRTRDLWLQNLDDQTAAEAYSKIFGHSARQWAFPPLNQLVRLYPLGLEVSPGKPERIVRSPLQVEVDGSFRMNTVIAEGEVAHLMIGDPQACLESARQALRQALAKLGGAHPLLAIIFVDLSWQLLFETHPGQLTGVLREELGNIPVIGAYTFGQVTRPEGENWVRFQNQAFLAAVIGETSK
jgi:hypothetical protein